MGDERHVRFLGFHDTPVCFVDMLQIISSVMITLPFRIAANEDV